MSHNQVAHSHKAEQKLCYISSSDQANKPVLQMISYDHCSIVRSCWPQECNTTTCCCKDWR